MSEECYFHGTYKLTSVQHTCDPRLLGVGIMEGYLANSPQRYYLNNFIYFFMIQGLKSSRNKIGLPCRFEPPFFAIFVSLVWLWAFLSLVRQ